MSRAHGAIILLVVALGADLAVSARAAAASLWFIGWGSDDWHASAQWMNEESSLFAGPPFDFVTPVYVTSFDVWTNVASVITSPARTGTLYVGGWPSEFDSFAGRAPSGEAGVLRIHADLTTGDDAYIGIGVRDAVGSVEHTAGRIAAEHGSGRGLSMYLGLKSAEAEGHYSLSGSGVFARRHLTVGGNGLGVFEMSGGEIEGDGCGCTSFVGQGYDSVDVDEGRIPAVGLWDQSGGYAKRGSVVLGDSAGSVGIVRMHGESPTLATWDHVTIGRGGVGNLVMSRGVVSSWRFALGEEAGSFGMVSLIGGALVQNRRWEPGRRFGVYVGVDGAAQLTIVGGKGLVLVQGRYEQNGKSVVEFQLVPSAIVGGVVTPIRVTDLATFQDGALVRVTLSEKFADDVPSHVTACDRFLLFSYGAAQGLDGLVVETPSDEWVVEKDVRWLAVSYDPGGRC